MSTGSNDQIVHIGEGERAFRHLRLPRHCARDPRHGPELRKHERRLRQAGLTSVCEEAKCPNRGECWERGHVTFMLMGDVCTRSCRFCAVATGKPALPPDPEEPARVAEMAAELGLSHVVLTSVNRDDLPDGGAGHFAKVIGALRGSRPEATIEVLTPDFRGDLSAVGAVCDAGPDVFHHNVETVPRLYREVRPGARFQRSLYVLAEAVKRRSGMIVKSGVMVGLGEERAEVLEVMRVLRETGVHTLTVGQYLRPSRHHLPVQRYWDPEEYESLAREGEAMGFVHVASGPLVRSSFNADATLQKILSERPQPAGGA